MWTKKPASINENLVQTMNGWGISIGKKIYPKNRKKNRKNQNEIAACEQKPPARKRLLV